jgi:hypothetical protein
MVMHRHQHTVRGEAHIGLNGLETGPFGKSDSLQRVFSRSHIPHIHATVGNEYAV